MATLRIAIVRRAGDGLIQIAAVSDVAANLRLLQSFGVEIDAQTATHPARHARSIVAALRARFHRAAIDGGPWYAIEFFEAREALAEYDLDSGERHRAPGLELARPVRVDGIGEGLVTGFSACGRVQVSINRFPRGVLTTLAPANQVHAL